MAEQSEAAGLVLDQIRESVTGIRIAVRMRRSDDAPTEEIELLADELVDADQAQLALSGDDCAPTPASMPPLPPVAALRVSRPRAAPQLVCPPAGQAVQPVDRSEPAQLRLDLERSRRQREDGAYLRDLEKVYAQRCQELLEADRREASLASRVHQQALRIVELERQLHAQSALVEQPQAAATQRVAQGTDELLRIRGIGSSYARALRALGVDSLAAIAAWGPADVSEISRRLNIKSSRIQRDRWIEQARTLLGDEAARA
jgi:predicted flap endonuclease-1-like 5' DNA nuclease